MAFSDRFTAAEDIPNRGAACRVVSPRSRRHRARAMPNTR
ncbi:hypothetical protein UO65_3010 [Actinokineospora spheciospongiae]|uniref:Uncharacterized protein n=1 Tax=Actinokineospora spheciospongiae TaxID=909613 RepID=W7IXR9_9PSEU|nr:hypothetical protein UO65_3010 [Actinokineospora spheciospongiae]